MGKDTFSIFINFEEKTFAMQISLSQNTEVPHFQDDIPQYQIIIDGYKNLYKNEYRNQSKRKM